MSLDTAILDSHTRCGPSTGPHTMGQSNPVTVKKEGPQATDNSPVMSGDVNEVQHVEDDQCCNRTRTIVECTCLSPHTAHMHVCACPPTSSARAHERIITSPTTSARMTTRLTTTLWAGSNWGITCACSRTCRLRFRAPALRMRLDRQPRATRMVILSI